MKVKRYTALDHSPQTYRLQKYYPSNLTHTNKLLAYYRLLGYYHKTIDCLEKKDED